MYVAHDPPSSPLQSLDMDSSRDDLAGQGTMGTGANADDITVQMARHAEQAAALLKVLSNPSRLLILCHLSQGECHVGRLEELTGLSQPVISQHLARLRAESIVTFRRLRQQVIYSIRDENALEVLKTLYRLYCGDGAVSEV